MAKIAVVGAGIIGATSAFILARAGHEVTLIDRNAESCLGASQRNGAQLSYAYCDALGSPSLIRHLPEILLGHDPAYRVSLALDPEFLIWGLRFLTNSTHTRFLRNTEALLQIADVSKQLLAELISTYDLSFNYRIAGKLVLVPSTPGIEAARSLMTWKTQRGLKQVLLSRQEAESIEPALKQYQDEFAAAVYSPEDAVGCPRQFSKQLLAIATEQFGLRTRFGVTAKRIVTRQNRACGIELDKEEREPCDIVVVSTGIGSSLRTQVRPRYAQIWPVQGYSASLPVSEGLFNVSITDTRRKLVFARLGGELRIAGIADIGSRDLAFRQDRFQALVDGARSAFGSTVNVDEGSISPWAGARPVTPSSIPVIARTPTKGVFANYGHGTLGWTLALGASEELRRLIDEDCA
ncbi:FAD-dependent oxidoreductase [Aestuariispira ectoiniformans]|uniref:FAD-dependent oxidoreductase n=1 Tax=Aestuariispira ectoiniformans TaxID=2775080 RepID=UPI00223AD32A|nr:FAD-dependent oxidoreductase [Aestuariispira ectoiniformans]